MPKDHRIGRDEDFDHVQRLLTPMGWIFVQRAADGVELWRNEDPTFTCPVSTASDGLTWWDRPRLFSRSTDRFFADACYHCRGKHRKCPLSLARTSGYLNWSSENGWQRVAAAERGAEKGVDSLGESEDQGDGLAGIVICKRKRAAGRDSSFSEDLQSTSTDRQKRKAQLSRSRSSENTSQVQVAQRDSVADESAPNSIDQIPISVDWNDLLDGPGLQERVGTPSSMCLQRISTNLTLPPTPASLAAATEEDLKETLARIRREIRVRKKRPAQGREWLKPNIKDTRLDD